MAESKTDSTAKSLDGIGSLRVWVSLHNRVGASTARLRPRSRGGRVAETVVACNVLNQMTELGFGCKPRRRPVVSRAQYDERHCTCFSPGPRVLSVSCESGASVFLKHYEIWTYRLIDSRLLHYFSTAYAGFYALPWGQHPRVQILTVGELLAGKKLDAPLFLHEPGRFEETQADTSRLDGCRQTLDVERVRPQTTRRQSVTETRSNGFDSLRHVPLVVDLCRMLFCIRESRTQNASAKPSSPGRRCSREAPDLSAPPAADGTARSRTVD